MPVPPPLTWPNYYSVLLDRFPFYELSIWEAICIRRARIENPPA